MKPLRFIYGGFGFQKGYNFVLYAITAGALLGFVLARVQYLDIDGIFREESIPGEYYWYQSGFRRVGIIMHLVGVLFGGMFAFLQFTPIIRHKALWFHRISGYLAILLLLAGNAGVYMIIDHSIGGVPAMRLFFGILGAMTTIGLLLAYVNIKRLQIDQHRAWMIRTWAWAGCIISLRLILDAATEVAHRYDITLHTPIRCDEIFFMYLNNAGIPNEQNPTGKIYEQCGDNASTNPLEILISTEAGGPESAAALLRPMFLMSAYLAITIHALLAELYLWLTPAEHYRLRIVSYQKQVEKGLRKRGSPKEAGLGSTRFGDAPEWWSLLREDQAAPTA
ncbi:hypothetical protein BU24DRAFT_433772 [Aaosphaeria arxii CBS 175.79]|uniref:DUF2306 domain-containing protein n=1 Tax=Aaosphaeria arxii CBS 175.79 TaxID=1450172 RepID=A0A6A5XMK6_9PLEO|nr:uncharacterized protein BU24DRAFT_433772 [Aaosphaeria arxii CBS 175.79]KAF2014372.1 hypothetical protein BU24DRAFT_433772 [Aaosphaeria arxii CBS 175.79]